MKKTALIFNPMAGKATLKKVDFAIDFLLKRDIEATLQITEKKLDAQKLSLECLKNNFDTIIVAGGDGTINETIQPLLFSGIKIGILPLGTANVVARELKIPLSFKKALKLIVEGKERKVCAGKITFTSTGYNRVFLLMAGLGFDAEVVFSNNDAMKRHFGKFSYLFTAFKTIFSYVPEKVTIFADGEEFSGYNAIISNSSFYGGNFKITKGASIFEPDFHSIILENDSPLDVIKVMISTLFKSHPAFDGLHFKITKKVEIKGKTKIQTDGEYIGYSPCVIEIIPNALTFVS